MDDTIQNRAMHYLYKEIKKARISICNAENKPNRAQEIANLQNKIEVLEWLADVALKEDCKDENA